MVVGVALGACVGVIVGIIAGKVVCVAGLCGGVSIAISIDTLGIGVSGGSELGGEEEVLDRGGSGIVDDEDEDVDDELEDVEDIDDEDDELEDDDDDDEVLVEVSVVVDSGSDASRCWRCSSSVVGGVDIVVLGSSIAVGSFNGVDVVGC